MKDYRTQEKQALTVLKLSSPDTWKAELIKARQEIKGVMLRQKYEQTPEHTREAMHYIAQKGVGDHSAYALLAAAHVLNEERRLLLEHQDYELRSMRLHTQLEKLKLKQWPQSHIETISEYYHNRLARYQAHIARIFKEMLEIRLPLCNPVRPSVPYISKARI